MALAIIAVTTPHLLSPLNKVWFRFGLPLHHLITPVVMGLLFFVGVVPLGLTMRWLGKDLLQLKIDEKAKSYWTSRDIDLDSKSMSDPF